MPFPRRAGAPASSVFATPVVARALSSLALAFVVARTAPARAQSAAPPTPAPAEPDTVRAPGVPEGRIETFAWKDSRVFPGTEREVSVYLPARLPADAPAPVLVVQDGLGHARGWGLPEVLDNLIHRGEIPALVGVFVTPGVVPPSRPDALPRYNRSFEYDGLGERYARLILDEILPEVARRTGVRLVEDGNGRAIAGASSGAIAAFTAAWERPDAFSRVLSTIGTYVGLRGGNEYPRMVRQHEPRPLRIFLEDGTDDLDNFAASWYVANQDMLAALRFSGYQVEHEFGPGNHSSKHARTILARALRFLWRGYPAPIEAGKDSRQETMRIVAQVPPGQPWASRWQPVAGVLGAGALVADREGSVVVAGDGGTRLLRVSFDAGGVASVAPLPARLPGPARALAVLPDGRVIAAVPERGVVWAVQPGGSPAGTTLAKRIDASALAASADGTLHVAVPGGVGAGARGGIYLLDGRGGRRMLGTCAATVSALLPTPDQSQLYAAAARGRHIEIFQRAGDGALAHRELWGHLHVPGVGVTDASARALAVDREGRVYVATALGVQVTDQLGRVRALLDPPTQRTDGAGPGAGGSPAPAGVDGVAFAGPERSLLVISAGGRLYVRPTKVSGVAPAFETFVPKKPGL